MAIDAGRWLTDRLPHPVLRPKSQPGLRPGLSLSDSGL
jgi:hypothetical protein